MNENNTNTNIENENEEVKKAIYSSKFLMNKELFYDFCSVSYNKLKKFFLFFLLFTATEIIVNIILKDYMTNFVTLFISFLLLLTYFITKRSIKINYERNLISAGKESSLHYELFEDKIVSHVDELKREYFYHQITKFLETKNFILLHLQYNLHITIEKSNLNASVDEVKSFLIEKCPHVKKKKFINCSNDKKWSLVFLIALIVVSVVGTVIGLILS